MTHLTKASIFRHWLPLASTWLMMAIEGPYLAAIVARMDNPKLNLAAFGVAFAVGLLMESPVIMMMAAAARLIKDQQSYFQLRRFNIILSISCTILMLGLLVPSVFNFWVYKLLMLDQQIGKYVTCHWYVFYLGRE